MTGTVLRPAAGRSNHVSMAATSSAKVRGHAAIRSCGAAAATTAVGPPQLGPTSCSAARPLGLGLQAEVLEVLVIGHVRPPAGPGTGPAPSDPTGGRQSGTTYEQRTERRVEETRSPSPRPDRLGGPDGTATSPPTWSMPNSVPASCNRGTFPARLRPFYDAMSG